MITDTFKMSPNKNRNMNTHLEHQRELEPEHQHPVLRDRAVKKPVKLTLSYRHAVRRLAKLWAAYPRPVLTGTGLSRHQGWSAPTRLGWTIRIVQPGTSPSTRHTMAAEVEAAMLGAVLA